MSNNWLNKIRSHQATPPEEVWLCIADELDKENETAKIDLKIKMYNYQSIPPSNALANIFATLDKEEQQASTSFNERIYNYQQEAPISAWKNIIAELDKSEAKIVPLTNNKKSGRAIYFRIAAAASVIAVIATTIWLSSRNTANPTNPIAAATPQIKTPVTAEVTIEQNKIPVNDGKEIKALPATDPQEKKLTPETIAQTKVKAVKEKTASSPTIITLAPNYVKNTPTSNLADDPTKGSNEKLQNTNGETPMDIVLMNTPNSYISITGPDGQSVKVSAKFSNLIGYLNYNSADTKENIDVIISESAKWRKIFAGWREKMTNNAVAPSIANFMDIISLSEVLEAKK